MVDFVTEYVILLKTYIRIAVYFKKMPVANTTLMFF